jgi:acetoin utilization deacetylase AcuC-like enzyme
VAILDWDIHHGDGTQSIFWNDPNVLFCSIHAQKAFPFMSGSSAKSVGGPNALGRTVNVAWTSHGMGDKEYLYALQTLIIPMLQEFQPTLILISAGFDAATGDAYGGNLSSVNGFGRMTTEILKVANEMDCPVIASLEGGYKQSVLGPCVASVVQSMVDFDGNIMIRTGNESDENSLDGFANGALARTTSSIHGIIGTKRSLADGICPTAVKNAEATRAAQKKYWKCLSAHLPKQLKGI